MRIYRISGSLSKEDNILQEDNIKPVVDVLDELIGQEGKNFRGILLHVMSNGKCIVSPHTEGSICLITYDSDVE